MPAVLSTKHLVLRAGSQGLPWLRMATSKDKSEDLSESVQPKRQIRLPTYLSDYQVNVTGHRELSSSHVGNMAAQTTFRSEEEGNTESDGTAKRRPSVGSASARPESRYPARDEWGTFLY